MCVIRELSDLRYNKIMIETGFTARINFVMTQARNNRLEFVTVRTLVIGFIEH
jgi:ATP-dependent Clp protease ATP-binding subunit ClpA (EC 3.4.21.92)